MIILKPAIDQAMYFFLKEIRVFYSPVMQPSTAHILPEGSCVLWIQEECRSTMEKAFQNRCFQLPNGLFYQNKRMLPLKYVGPRPALCLIWQPGILHHILGWEMKRLTNKKSPLSAICCPTLSELAKQLRLILASGVNIPQIRETVEQWVADTPISVLKENVFLATMRSFSNENENISTLLDLQQVLCTSKRNLERKFNKIIGLSPKYFLRLMRIKKAILLYRRNPEWNLRDLSFLCGFFDHAHFSRDFSSVMGYPPRDYFRFDNLYWLPDEQGLDFQSGQNGAFLQVI